MSKYLNTTKLDTYDAEIVEDIPEQFDLSRYKKNRMQQAAQNQQQQQQHPQSSSPVQQPNINSLQYHVTQNHLYPNLKSVAANLNQNQVPIPPFNSNLSSNPNLYYNRFLNPPSQFNQFQQIIPNHPSSSQGMYNINSNNLIHSNPYLNQNQRPQFTNSNQFSTNLNNSHIQQQNSHLQNQYNIKSPTKLSPQHSQQQIQYPQSNYYKNNRKEDEQQIDINYSPIKKKNSKYKELESENELEFNDDKIIVNKNKHSVTSNSPTSISSISSLSSNNSQTTISNNNNNNNNNNNINTKSSMKAASATAMNEVITVRKKPNVNGESENENEEHFIPSKSSTRQRDYYLKKSGSDDFEIANVHNQQNLISSSRKWPSNNDLSIQRLGNQLETLAIPTSASLSSTSTNTIPKSSLKSSIKKAGVKFDEKLEVYEVKNPHYGQEVKYEKREMRKKKKDKLKEEDIILRHKETMLGKIFNKYSNLYNQYERNLIKFARDYYEEHFYRNSILRLQEKVRNSKPDEKLRDQLLQMIEKDNQVIFDIIKHVKKDFSIKVDQYCNQYHITKEMITSPQVIPTLANSVNYVEIVNYHTLNKENTDSPSTFRKILGHEGKIEKFLSTNQLLSNSIKSPVQRKADLPLLKNDLAAIDLYVKEISHSSFNFKYLSDVIYKFEDICETEFHMARAIYKYILTTQLDNLRRNETGVLIMRNYDAGIESVNTIFSRLCSFAGLQNHLIRGLWKTICQEPGEKVEAKSVWNIVNLMNSWRFIQPAFTPVKYFSRQEIGYEETEFYFLSDSDLLFWEFLPSDKQWQFSDSSINSKDSIKEFEKKPIITPFFRTLNLAIINANHQNCMNIGKESFKLELKFPPELSESVNFKYVLKPIESSINMRNPAATSYITYEYNTNLHVISEINSDEGVVSFKISSLPDIGSYNLTIYASLIEDLNVLSSSMSNGNFLSQTSANEEPKAVISLKLNCTKIIPFEIPPNRITNNDISVFGTNLIMKKLGLKCCDFKHGIIGTDREGKLNLVFEMSQPLDIEAFLYSTDPSISNKCLELCMLKRFVHNFLILIINPPHDGLYGLDLHGAPRGTFNPLVYTQLPPIGKFLIKSFNQVRSVCQFPKGDNRQWGPKQRFYDLGMHTIGNIDPYIINEDGKQYEIEIAMLKPVTIWYKFDYDQNGTPKAIDNYCFMNYKNSNRREKTVSFLLRFPYRGFYHLALMANDDLFPSKPDEVVFNYLFRVQDPSNDVESFPIILNPILWKDCCLIAPKNFRLHSYDVHFSIIVPKTNQVQITNGERVIDRLEPKEIENSWVGLVTLNLDNSRYIYIEAEYENKFKKLIRFRGLGNGNNFNTVQNLN